MTCYGNGAVNHHFSSNEVFCLLASQSSTPMSIIAGHRATTLASELRTNNITIGITTIDTRKRMIDPIAAKRPNQSSTTLKIIQALYPIAATARILNTATIFGLFFFFAHKVGDEPRLTATTRSCSEWKELSFG